MAMRYEDATNLYTKTLEEISSTGESWTNFLKASCKNYRLPFADMVMIYAQRPDANAVLEMEEWNKRYGLWIKTGSKGIAVFDENFSNYPRLKYYFDISDTRESSKTRPVPIWTMQDDYIADVIETLTDQFGPIEEGTTLASAIIMAVNHAVEDNISDYLQDLNYVKTDSLLEELDEQNTAIVFQDVLANSIAYTILSRCGIYADDYISEDSLRQVSQFNTIASFNALGVPTRDISQMVINEIRKTVLSLEHEKATNRTFDIPTSNRYNKTEKEPTEKERSLHNENRIYETGRVPNTKSDVESSGTNHTWEVRNDEERISEEPSPHSIHELSDNADTSYPSDGNRPNGKSAERVNDAADEGTVTSERADEGTQSTEIHSDDESHRANDSRDTDERIDLQLNNNKEVGASFEIPAFFTLDEFEELLKYDRYRVHKNKEIQTVFEFYEDKEKRIAFVKESFNDTFIETLYQEQRMGFILDKDKDMLKVWKGNFLNPDEEAYVSWVNVTAFIEDMIDRNIYLSIPMKPILSEQKQQLNIFDMEPIETSQISRERIPFSMPQHIVDAILAEGAEERDSKLEIAIFFSLDLPVVQNVEFLKKQYRSGSNGFIIDNRNVSYTWDENGFQISWGKGIINAFDKQTLDWTDVAKGIRNLLDNGRYMSQDDLDKCYDFEYKKAANTLWYMCQDMDFDESNHMPTIREHYHGFPDSTSEIAELLKTKEFYDTVMQELNVFNKDYQLNHNLMRNNWRTFAPDNVIPIIERLAMPHLEFKAPSYSDLEYTYFITQDKIDSIISFENRSHQKYDTYSFFLNHQDKNERIKYLKGVWGESGSSNYDSSAKGLKIKKGSYIEPSAEILLKWKDVADRLSYLIYNHKYLNANEVEGLSRYESEQIVEKIKHFFCHLDYNNVRPYLLRYTYYEKNKELFEFIQDRENNVSHVLDLMYIALNNTAENLKYYDEMKQDISKVQEYYYGIFTLFNQKKEPLITTPYEPKADIKRTLSIAITKFMEEYDHYDYKERYNQSEIEEAYDDNRVLLNDTSGLEDLIKFFNEAVYECSEPRLQATAVILREEVSVLYADRRGSDLTKGNEGYFTFNPYISQEEPRYNTGDFVFLKINDERIYGAIQLIEDDSIVIEVFSDDIQDGLIDKDVEIDKEEFLEALVHDYRNGYIYDQSRPLHSRNLLSTKKDSLIVSTDKERNTLGYQNYVLLKRIAPLSIDNHADMVFVDKTGSCEIYITNEQDVIHIQEISPDIFKEYIFALDIGCETLNIREIFENQETSEVELIDGEVNDYNEEQQMNEFANDYIKSITNRGFHLKSINMQLNGKDTKIVYADNGHLSEFSGDIKEFDLFVDHFQNAPIQNISSLVPTLLEPNEKIKVIRPLDYAHENYLLLKKIAPLFLKDETSYMRFVAGDHMMPFSIEAIGDHSIAMSHYYEQNGDMIADPDVEFFLDTENETLSARSFQQDNMNYYRRVETDGETVIDTELEKELNEFTNQWMNNIINADYQLQTIRVYPGNYPEDVVYGSDGRISEFNGSDDDLKWFMETYGDPQNDISILLSDMDEEVETEILPAQKNIEDTTLQKTEVKKTGITEQINISSHRLLPEYTAAIRNDFKITNYDLGVGGLKEKYKANVTAIRLLKELNDGHRLATPDEQEILSHYVGWGSMPDVFDESKTNWSSEYKELKTLLNESEYKAARESTLTAFYTPPIVIESIYKKLLDMGLTEGNILEPSCGVGNFIGMQPSSMDCHFYGVELDSISGNIAKQLYQNATIAVQGFEKTEIPNNLFDAVVGNVPYGQIPIYDPVYNQQKFMVHDYFFAKSLDKVKVGGVVIFLTSKFTMDKQNQSARKYIAQRADLLGAIRLPDDVFKANAGTRVTTDILILQKREKPLETEPEWLNIMQNENGIKMNSYFISHPDMVLGNMVEETSQYGLSTACKPVPYADIKQQLSNAMSNINATVITNTLYVDEEDKSIPADPTVRNFSFCISDGTIYYRENSRMFPYETTKTGENRIRGMIQIRDCMRMLIDLQMNDYPLEDINKQQQQLHSLYDSFTKKYNLLNSRANKLAFQDDSSYSLICSLEVLNEDKSLKRKADIFDKITIRPRQSIESVKTASEALIVSMAEKGHVDFNFMTKLSGIEKEDLIENLQNVIFPNPTKQNEFGEPTYETADEYLSGDVREKLIMARHAAKKDNLYLKNVTALENVQPERIKAGDISVRIGTTWIPPRYYREFMHELLDTPSWQKRNIDVLYLSSTQEWNVTRKTLDKGVKSTKTYGTNRINAYKIIENTLNLRDVKIFDKVLDDAGNEVRVLNKRETAIAQDKQDIIKAKFSEWIWKDPERRDILCDIYNEKFNSIRNRTYDGSNLAFIGMNPEVELRKHQVDAIARILYGGNTLLAHTVGAGKTFEMIAAGMESKRLGFCTKQLYVVPNNIIGDFASDFYRLYPSANILVATTESLSKNNRHRFFSQIAACEWDGIIMTHSQFIKSPVSPERQKAIIGRQIEDITNNLQMLKEQNGERFSIKQLEKMKQKLETKLEKLNDDTRKDDILYFEELGVDMLFVDEADLFKNLFLYTKMRNVSGISQTDSQRASDLFMKTQYLSELTNYRGVVFATGTAISNSMAELYTMQRYLQYDALKKYNLESFDAWASTFGETVTAMELSPEGSGFRLKTRFSKFFNLPELMTIFREVADIQTADMLNLPVPKTQFDVVSVPASKEQTEMINALADRAEKVRNREVAPYEDNMLKITSDGRKVALEQRLLNPLLPENINSKVNACINNAYTLWQESSNIKGTQLIFCDLSTPKKGSKDMDDNNGVYEEDENNEFFSVYDEIKKKLIDKGISKDEIAFIHDAKTDVQRKDLFAKVRQGNVRILLGSTSKMGAGTNVQDLIVALHDLDCPWRPRDLEQRRGRGIRQGNINELVHVKRYVTEGTFDAYLYQTIEKKQQFISQVLTGKTPQRVMEEIDEAVLNYAEIKAIACGDPKIMERCNLDMEVSKLNVLKASYQNQKFELQDSILKVFPKKIAEYEQTIACLTEDIKLRNKNPLPDGENFTQMMLDGVLYKDKAEAGNMLIELCKQNTTSTPSTIGEYRSFKMNVFFSSLSSEYVLSLENKWKHSIIVGTDKLGNITRINNALNSIEKMLEETQQALTSVKSQLETAMIEVEKPFEREEELQDKTKRLAELTLELKLDEKDPSIIDEDEVSTEDMQEEPKSRNLER